MNNVIQGYFSIPFNTGNTAYTGIGFQPALGLFTGGKKGSSGITDTQVHFCIGRATSASNQSVDTWYEDAGSGGQSKRNVSNCIAIWEKVAGVWTEIARGALVSWDVDGFTINWTVIPNGAYSVNGVFIA